MTEPRKLTVEELEEIASIADDASVADATRRIFSALLAHIAARDAEAAAEERLHTQTIQERDAVQELFDELYFVLLGRGPEYSNLFNATDAFDDCAAAIRALKEKT